MEAPQSEIDLLKNELFVRWVKNPNKELNEYWQRWMEENPDNVQMVHNAVDMIKSFQLKNWYQMDEHSHTNILDSLIQYNQLVKSGTTDSPAERPVRRPAHWMIAASLLLASAVLIGVFLKTSQKISTERNGYTLTAGAGDYLVKVVSAGQRSKVTLPDGSQVNLNSLSELRYPTVFSDTLREVYLSGQAFFEVTKNKHAPFIVRTKDFSTKVLGTSFDVRAYDDDQEKHVAVVTGKVKVNANNGQSRMLMPNQMTIYRDNGVMVVKKKFVQDVVVGWKDGIIEFQDADFKDVIVELSRWYGVEFKLADGVVIDGRYTGRFHKETLENVMMGVAYSSHFQYKIQGNEVLIYR